MTRLKIAAAETEHPGQFCTRRLESSFTFPHQNQTWQSFVFEPLGSNLLDYTNRPANRPFPSQSVRWITIYLLHAIDFLHKNGIVHTGQALRFEEKC